MAIRSRTDEGIFELAFDRPDKKNAITADMYAALADGIARATQDADVRALTIQGSDSVFTAGNDLEDFLKNPPRSDDSPVFRFLHAISTCPKPIVAAVAGPAVGVGTTMLLHCDLVYAADNARFSVPFVQLGLCPEAASSLLLPALAGYQRAAEKLLLGEPFDAAEARDMGLVSKVLPAVELLGFARAQARKLARLPASSIRATKRLMKADRLETVAARMRDEGEAFGAMLASPEAREAFSAFLEKRAPDFSRFS